jgi:hypothetical protein
MASDHRAPDQTVGYRKPPAHGRFQPGKSGNEKGRPKGSKSLKADLRDELDELVIARENGKEVLVTKQRLLVKTLVSRAIKNDIRAANAIFALCMKFGTDSSAGEPSDSVSDDQKIVEEFIEKEITRRSKIQLAGGASETDATNFNDAKPKD